MQESARTLQCAARAAARALAPGVIAHRVVILDANNQTILDVVIPNVSLSAPEADPETVMDLQTVTPTSRPGWVVSERVARYDGKVIAVSVNRVRLLKVLVESETPMMAKELRERAFDRETSEENVVYHIKTLRKELSAAFPDFPGEIIPNDNGYSIALR